MITFLYRCPNTGYRVQGFVAEEATEDGGKFKPVQCVICQRLHLVRPETGEVMGHQQQ